MTAATRRLWLYGLLLLLPALAVGGLALGLLAREQTRLAERETAASDARRAAVEARARLIAENIELLVADVQTTLMGTLQAAPADEPRTFLAQWQVANPLVREVFRSTADGRSVWGAESAPVRDWLAAAPWVEPAAKFAPDKLGALADEVRLRRDSKSKTDVAAKAADAASESPAPALAPSASEPAPVVAMEFKTEMQRRAVTSNVSQYQSARQEIQKVASQAPPSASNSFSSNGAGSSFRPRVAEKESQAGFADADDSLDKTNAKNRQGYVGGRVAGSSYSDAVELPESAAARVQAFSPLDAPVLALSGGVQKDSAGESAGMIGSTVSVHDEAVGAFADAASASYWNSARGRSFSAGTPVAATASVPILPAVGAEATTPMAFGVTAPGRAGWTPWRDAGGKLHLFGWRELPDGTFIGIELALDAIKSRFREVFPAVIDSGQGFVLRDATGAVWHAVAASTAHLVNALPLSSDFLPGWTIEARDAGGYQVSSGAGVFAVGAAIIVLLVLAIVAAGALLLRQARRSEAEAELKTSFVANVSHELKTPLTTIRLYAELLAQGRVREEQKRGEYLAVIGQETQRLARLVGNVLDFSRLEQGKKKYERGPVDLAAELRALAATHAPRLASAGLGLAVSLPERCEIVSDRDAVAQIVLNLLDNACKYAAEGGEAALTLVAPISGTAPASGGFASVIVADRGPGVPEAQRERIFEKFHRVDDRLTAEKGGAGLGLSIARQLARGLGGDLVHRPRGGGGSEFILTLPVSSL